MEYTTDYYKLLKSRIDFYEAQGINLSIAKFHVIIAKIFSGNLIGSNDIGRDAVRTAQQNFSIANFELSYPSYSGKITTMITYNTDTYVRADNVHLNIQAYHLEGHRLASYISKL